MLDILYMDVCNNVSALIYYYFISQILLRDSIFIFLIYIERSDSNLITTYDYFILIFI